MYPAFRFRRHVVDASVELAQLSLSALDQAFDPGQLEIHTLLRPLHNSFEFSDRG